MYAPLPIPKDAKFNARQPILLLSTLLQVHSSNEDDDINYSCGNQYHELAVCPVKLVVLLELRAAWKKKII